MKKFDLSLFTISILILGLVIMGMTEEDPKVVAKVNGHPITENQYFFALKKQYGEQILDQLVTESLIKQEADKNKIEVTAKEVEDELDKMKKNMGTTEQFNQFLQQYKMSEEQVKERLKMNMMVEKMIADELQVTEEEMKSFYEANKDRFGSEAPAYEQVKEQIKNTLLEQKEQEKIPVWLEGLKKKANIEDHTQLPKSE